LFGNVEWKDLDKINRVIPAKVAADKAYQNARKNPDRQDARIEGDGALQQVMRELLADHTELFTQFGDNPGFKKWLSDTIFQSVHAATRPIVVRQVSLGRRTSGLIHLSSTGGQWPCRALPRERGGRPGRPCILRAGIRGTSSGHPPT